MENGIFEEIDEEVKKEQALVFMKKHIKVISGVLISILLLIVCYSVYLSNYRKDSENYTKRLVNVLFEYDGNVSSIERDLDYLIKNADRKIANIANIIKLGLNGDDTSAKLLNIAENKNYDGVIRDVALLIYVSRNFDKLSYQEVIKMLEKISFANHPYRFTALELIMVAAIQNNNLERARAVAQTIASDKDAPAAMKNRVRLLNLD